MIIALDNTSDYWVLDLGASCHATPHRKLFHDYVPSDFGHVLMGKVRIKLNNGNELLLKYVRNIPTMKRNMISTRQLEDNDCLSMFGKTWWKITKGALVIEKGDMIGALYLFPIKLIIISMYII